MLFNSIPFLCFFLPAVLAGYYFLGVVNRWSLAIYWLLVASLFFYSWWNPIFVLLLISSILVNFSIGIPLGKWKKTSRGKALLGLGIAGNLAVLCYFKYVHFFAQVISSVGHFDLHFKSIILPLGISFFTFQQIVYLVDIYRKEAPEYKLANYALFVSLFPHLIAGPLTHHKDIIEQLEKKELSRFIPANFAMGLSIFCSGLFKKMVLADNLAKIASPIFEAAHLGTVVSFFESWAAALAYTFQLYFDFSGYSDMAIGIALLFNIVLPINFNSPYKARSIIDFWRRWHMTLSGFLRNYLYIPLGGNRQGTSRRYVNLMLTMVLGGLWHGAGWTFILWGGLHGGYLIVNHMWQSLVKKIGFAGVFSTLIGKICAWVLTFGCIVVGWVLFRAVDLPTAGRIFCGMLGLNGVVLPSQIASLVPFVLPYVQVVGSMPLLAGGTVMGIVEMLGLFVLAFGLIWFPANHELSPRLRLVIWTVTFYFVVQALFFGSVPSEFLYFKF